MELIKILKCFAQLGMQEEGRQLIVSMNYIEHILIHGKKAERVSLSHPYSN